MCLGRGGGGLGLFPVGRGSGGVFLVGQSMICVGVFVRVLRICVRVYAFACMRALDTALGVNIRTACSSY